MISQLASTCSGTASQSSDESNRLALILDEYLKSIEQGAPIAPEELLARHPDLADRLRGYLSGVAIFHNAANPPLTWVTRDDEQGQELRGVLGDFRLVREIGRGGMGVVYESVQLSLGRRVALKVLPFSAAVDEKQIMRFQNEAQAAAQVDHPNIVPVFAVGQEHGIHYFAMQLIVGQSLSDLIHDLRVTTIHDATTSLTNTSAHTLPATETFEHVQTIAGIGVQAAEALHAAHEIGVVHRDVKPSNLLIDEKGKVFITDFGVARCRASSKLTETGYLPGTMRYMSPEQAQGRTELVDHRTDIYSLGVTLYELVTLRHPFQGASDAELASTSRRDDWYHPRYWNHVIPRDFENIVLKAMAESREERYASARELAEDLQRFIDGKPTLARRPSLTARMNKWAWRHRKSVVASMVALVLAVSGLLASLVMISAQRAETEKAYKTATLNHQRAQRNHEQAQAKLRQARELLDRFGSHVAQGLENIPGAERLRKELLAEMLPYFREFARESVNDPSLRADLALTYSKIGYLSDQLGLQAEAETAYEEAHAILTQLVGNTSSPSEHQRSLAQCCNNLGHVRQKRGNVSGARAEFENALVIQQELVATWPSSTDYQTDLATTYSNLGLLLNEIHDGKRAEAHFRSAIQIQESIARFAPHDQTNRRNLAVSYNNLSSLFIQSQPEVARHWIEKAMSLQLSLAKDFPMERDYQSDLALSFNNLGATLSRLALWTDAQECFSDAIAIQARLVMAAPLVTVFRRDLAVSYNNLGMSQSSAGALDEAEASFKSALEMQQEMVAAHPQDVAFQSGLAGIFNNLGMVHQERRQWSEACDAFEQAIAVQKSAYERAPDVVYFRESLSKHYYNYAQTLRSLERYEDAAAVSVARRELWLNDASRLVRIAEELAATCKQMPLGVERQRYLVEITTTLDAAKAAGLEKLPDLAASPFDVLSSDSIRSISNPSVGAILNTSRSSHVQ